MSRGDSGLVGGRRPRGRPRKSDGLESPSSNDEKMYQKEILKPSTSRDERLSRHAVGLLVEYLRCFMLCFLNIFSCAYGNGNVMLFPIFNFCW